MSIKYFLAFFLFNCSCAFFVHAQEGTTNLNTTYKKQIDLIDIGNTLINNKVVRKIDTAKPEPGSLHSAILPGVGYSLQTGFAAVLQFLGGFYTSKDVNANQSSIECSFNYTQLHQLLIPLQINLWTDKNKYNIQSDWRYLVFPQNTYGLGGYSSVNNAYILNFSNIRLYTTCYKEIKAEMYFGIGYNFDYIWNIKEINPPTNSTDFIKYNKNYNEQSNFAVASAPTLSFLYDTRRNSINPPGGDFINLIYRPNSTFLGSSENWQSLIVDVRKYIALPLTSKNILAFWSYNWLTLSGAPPYILLPNIGGDPYANTGRGFTEGRFRSKNMLYYENEYRFGILKNGMLGGVVFANIESFSEENNNQFARIYAGYGAGLRIKFNKFSNTNVAIDYGFGSDGSKGVFINLGEIF